MIARDFDFDKKEVYLASLGFSRTLEPQDGWNVFFKRINYQNRNKTALHTVKILMRPHSDHAIISIIENKQESNLFVGRIGSTSQLMYILSCTYVNDLQKH